jgi:hypothetical protein
MHAAAAIVVALSLVTPAEAAPTATAPTSAAKDGWDEAPSSPALGPDEVQLENGGFVRGTLVEVTPEQRVVIVPDGSTEPRTIPWEEIAKVERGKHDPNAPKPDASPTPAPAPAPGAAASEETPSPGRPRVHLELTKPRATKLYIVDSEIVASGYYSSMYGIQFRSICTAPCDRVIDGSRGQAFFLATGDNAVWNASRKFSLDANTGDVRIRVRPGSTGLRIAGAVLLGLGLGGLIGGAVLAILDSTRTAGIGLLAGGAPLFAAGLPMMIVGRTRYEFVK